MNGRELKMDNCYIIYYICKHSLIICFEQKGRTTNGSFNLIPPDLSLHKNN